MIEKALISTLLAFPDSVFDVMGKLMPEDFESVACQETYRAILSLVSKSRAVDALVVISEMETTGVLGRIGGQVRIMEFIQDMASSPLLAQEYAVTVIEASKRREMVKRLHAALEAAKDKERPLHEVCGLAESAALAGVDREGENRARLADSFLKEIFEDMQRQNSGEMLGIPTGLKDVDLQTGGGEGGNVIILAGRPGTGKTSLGIQILKHNCDNGKVGIFFSGEMRAKEIARRALTQTAQVNDQLIRRGKLPDREWPKLSLAIPQLQGKKFIIDDTPGITPLQILSRGRRTKAKIGLDLMIIDNLQLMKGDGKYKDRRLELQDISNTLKRIAKDLNVPIFEISHLNRESDKDGKPPSLHNLKECGDFEQDADTVMLLYHPAESKDPTHKDFGHILINLAKLRFGETGTIPILFDGSTTTFRNSSHRQDEPPPRNQEYRDFIP